MQRVPGFFPRVKRPEREVNHSTSRSDEIKNACSYASTPLYAFIALTGKTLHLLWCGGVGGGSGSSSSSSSSGGGGGGSSGSDGGGGGGGGGGVVVAAALVTVFDKHFTTF